MPLIHERLIVWQRADDLFVEVHRLTARFPKSERFGLVSQMRRSAYSVPANIVEGMARRSMADRARFLNIAEASLAELNYCLHVCKRLNYMTDEEHRHFSALAMRTGAPLAGLIRQVKPVPR